MTNEEIRKRARSLIIDALISKGFLSSDGVTIRNQKVTFNGNGTATVKIVETEIGEVGFSCNYSSNFGKSNFEYTPQPYVERLIKTAEIELKKYKEGDYDAALLDNLRTEWEIEIVNITTTLVTISIDELLESVHLLPALALNITSFLSDGETFVSSEAKNRAKVGELLNEINSRRKERILELAKAKKEYLVAPQYLFCDAYDWLLKEWQEARACYRNNQKNKNVIEMVKVAFPDLPGNLIEQLGDLDPYTAKASTIALIHTALFLNVPSKIKAIRTLEKYLQDSRSQRLQVSDEEAAKAFEKYLDYLENTENQ